MMRASRQIHLVVIAALLVSAFLYLQSSWHGVETGAGVERPATMVERPVQGVGKEEKHDDKKDRPVAVHEAAPKQTSLSTKGLAKDAKKGVKQAVLHRSSTETPAATPTSSTTPTTLQRSTSEQTKPTASPSSRTSRSSRSAPPAAASSAPPLIPFPDPSKITPTYDRAIVVGKLQREDVSWVGDKLPDWQRAVYTIDSPTSGQLHTLINKGHNAMPFLTYIIEHYDKLPSIVVFAPSSRTGFLRPYHFEGEEFDIVDKIRLLDMDFVRANGYANLRCTDVIGCPSEDGELVSQNPRNDRTAANKALSEAWRELFGVAPPSQLGGSCSSEFVVSKEQILQRPLSDYYHYLDWLYRTTLDDNISGAIFECSWHVIFGKDPVFCPKAKQCFCDLYRKC